MRAVTDRGHGFLESKAARLAAVLIATLLGALPAGAAVQIFSGLDNVDLSAGGAHPNADRAAADFAAAAADASNVYLQDFESLPGGSTPSNFSIGPIEASLTALASDYVHISDTPSQYSTFAVAGSHFLDALTDAGEPYFAIGFDAPVRAIGFYITDASDWLGATGTAANLTIRLFSNSGDTEIALFAGVSPSTIVNGNVGFFGAVDTTAPFSGFSISNLGPNPADGNGEDAIGLDALMAAPVPLPGALALYLTALLALGARVLARPGVRAERARPIAP